MGAGAGMTTAMMAKPGSMSKNMQPMQWAEEGEGQGLKSGVCSTPRSLSLGGE
jgi:hypothetical protein